MELMIIQKIKMSDIFIANYDEWDFEELTNCGLIHWLDVTNRMHREINFNKVNTHAKFGSTDQDLIKELKSLHKSLGEVIENIEAEIKGESENDQS